MEDISYPEKAILDLCRDLSIRMFIILSIMIEEKMKWSETIRGWLKNYSSFRSWHTMLPWK